MSNLTPSNFSKISFNKFFLIALFLVSGVLSGCSDPRSYIETSLHSRDVDYRSERSQKPLTTASIKKKTSVKKTKYKTYSQLGHVPRNIPAQTIRYTVKEGDTLYGISYRYGVSLRSLARVNRLDDAKIRPGQQLLIPVRHQVVDKRVYNDEQLVTASLRKPKRRIRNDELYARHILDKQQRVIVVGSGDTLSGLAHQYKMPERSIIAANKLEGDKIYYGQRLIIPHSCEPFCS